MKFKFGLILLLLSVVSVGGMHAAGSASSFMNDASQLLTSSKSLTASFKIESDAQTSVLGNIVVKDNKFAIITSDNSTIYDGNNQWTISAADREISIFEPTDEEIAQVNPFSIIKSYKQNYNLKLLSADNSKTQIELKAKRSDSNIKKVVITFVSSSKLPSMMTLSLDDGTNVVIGIFNIKTNTAIDDSKFTVSTNDYPGYEIIDLR